MVKWAFLFPGQGSQYKGMGKDFYDTFPEARKIFEEADRYLNFSLSKIIFDGTEDELKRTEITQPAILTVSVAIYEVIKKENIKPSFVAGHSLGEYSAIVCAGGMEFKDAVRTVHFRGKFMQEAVPEGQGAMAAIISDKIAEIEEAVKQAQAVGCVVVANYNAPNQYVISGKKEAVDLAIKIIKEKNIGKAIPLKVSAPFHSPLMEIAGVRLKAILNNLDFKDLQFPLVNNVDAEIVREKERVRDGLIRQVPSPVKWTQSILKLKEEGVEYFLEVGPGKVLTGLLEKIYPQAKVFFINDLNTLNEFLDKFKS
ncbi:MAG: ACP S-malonyltransferase [Thermoanaerobaculia bacterium]